MKNIQAFKITKFIMFFSLIMKFQKIKVSLIFLIFLFILFKTHYVFKSLKHKESFVRPRSYFACARLNKYSWYYHNL